MNQNELMITMPKYKNYLLTDCYKIKESVTRDACVKHVVSLILGDVNYISTRGKRAQENICDHVQKVPGCSLMCEAFFLFYPEPTRFTCLFVGGDWRVECDLRATIKIARDEGWEEEAKKR